MYAIVVLLLMFLLPAGSVYAEYTLFHAATPLIVLAGKWYVFWGVGVRLLLAGLRQYFQPSFTAKQIFHMQGDEALPLVRELGIANFASGVVGFASLARPDFVLPVAISAGIFYGIAGVRHVAEGNRSFNETLAMASDLFAFVVLAAFAGYALACL
jgi:hypothetical protein